MDSSINSVKNSSESILYRFEIFFSFCLQNKTPNHRANDTMVVDSGDQIIHGKFHYGPIDMVTLSDETVDIFVMRSAPYGEWVLLDSVETDDRGQILYTIPEEKKLPIGLHPLKMVVR